MSPSLSSRLNQAERLLVLEYILCNWKRSSLPSYQSRPPVNRLIFDLQCLEAIQHWARVCHILDLLDYRRPLWEKIHGTPEITRTISSPKPRDDNLGR
jgi:hypothetical protein